MSFTIVTIEMKWKSTVWISTLTLTFLILVLASTYAQADKLTDKVDVYVKAQMERSGIFLASHSRW